MTLPSTFPLPPTAWTTNNPVFSGIVHPGGVGFPNVASAPIANTPLIAFELDQTYPDETLAVMGKYLTSSSFAVWSEGHIVETASLRAASDRAQAILLKNITSATVSEPEITTNQTVRRSVTVIWPKNATGWGYPIRINRPKVTTTWPITKWAFDGDRNMQLFGKNLWIRSRQSKVYVQRGTDKPIRCNILTSHENELHIEIPIGLPEGACRVWVHNGTGGQYGWSDPVSFTNVAFPYNRGTIYYVEDMAGGTDQLKIEAAITAALAVGGAHIVFADKSVKTYTITANLSLAAFGSPQTVKPIIFEGPENGEAHIQNTADELSISMNSAGSEIRNMKLTGVNIFVNHKDCIVKNVEVSYKSINGCLNTWYYFRPVRFSYQGDMNLLVENCTFRFENCGAKVTCSNIKFLDCHFYGRYHDGTYDADGTLRATSGTEKNLDNHGITTRGSHRMIVENCNFESENVATGRILTPAVACMQSGDTNHVLKNNTVRWVGAFDTATNRDTNTGEVFLFHGGESSLKGTVTGTSTSTTVTLSMSLATFNAHDFGTLDPTNEIEDRLVYLQVITGDGKGQTRVIKSATGTSTTILEVDDWQNVLPVSGDIVSMGPLQVEHVIFGNDIDAVPIPSAYAVDFGRTGITFWRPQHGCVINDNIIKNCGGGIVVTSAPTGLWTQGPLYIRNNTITDCLAGGPFNVSPTCFNIMLYYEYISPAMLHSFGNVFRDNILADSECAVSIGSFHYDDIIAPRNDATFTMDANTGMIHSIIENNAMTDMPLRADSLNIKYAISLGANWLLMRNNTCNSAQVKAVYNLGKTHESVLIVANVVVP